MNLISLILHGLSAIAVYCDVALARLLLLMVGVSAISLLGVLAVVLLRLFTDLAMPGWASDVIGSLLIIVLQSVIFSSISVFLLLNNRSAGTIIPAVEAERYIAGVRKIQTNTIAVSAAS